MGAMHEMLEEKLARFEELERLMVDPEILADSAKLVDVVREHGSIAKLATCYRKFRNLNNQISEANEMIAGSDPEMRELAEMEQAQDTPAPTNDVQKAIWDEIHAMPTEPIKIKPETKKVSD